MPSAFTHAFAAAALTAAFPVRVVPRRWAWLGAACAMVPDLDVIGFSFGVPYDSLLGHRGLSHSIAFAVVFSGLAGLAAAPLVVPPARRGWVWCYLFLATMSHAVLDAFTDGGLGVAFFSPFDPKRYLSPVTPIMASPIGANFFSARGLEVLWCEMRWVWLPAALFAAGALGVRRLVAAWPVEE